MTEPWAQSYETLSSAGHGVLLGLAALGASTFETRDVGVLAGLDQREAAPALAELARGGWVSEIGPDRWTVSAEAEHRVASLAGGLSPTVGTTRVRAFVRHLTASLDEGGDTPLDARRGATIIAAVTAAGRLKLVDEALALTVRTWRATTPTNDWAWWHQLAHVSEEIATEAREADRLIELLQESGAAYARTGAGHRADRQWRRAFSLTDATYDHARSAELLLLIGERRRTAGLLGQALTIFHELIRLFTDTNDRLGLAEALIEMTVTLLRAGRRGDAEHYLGRAIDTLTAEEPSPTEVTRRTQALVRIGRLWEQLGSPGKAVPLYSSALAMLVDVDDETADEVRALLAVASRAKS